MINTTRIRISMSMKQWLHVNQVKLVDRRRHILSDKNMLISSYIWLLNIKTVVVHIVFYFVEDTHWLNIKIKSAKKYVGKIWDHSPPECNLVVWQPEILLEKASSKWKVFMFANWEPPKCSIPGGIKHSDIDNRIFLAWQLFQLLPATREPSVHQVAHYDL